VATEVAPPADTQGEALKRILFVDDDELLLESLRDALRPYRRRWQMTFVISAADALATMDEQTYDVVVSDLRMPSMDGASLLDLVRERCPAAVRIVLSGQADMTTVARAAAVAHRLISKPCETAELATVIERSCALVDMAARVELDRHAIGASALPSAPAIYAELSELMASGTASAADAAHVVERDIAMAAKVLQLANCAYFGRRTPVASVPNAVAYLGVDALRALVLHTVAFQQFDVGPRLAGFSVEALHDHCIRVAQLASAIVSDPHARGAAFTAGLLHDVGLLVLAWQDRDEVAEMLAIAHEQHCPIEVVERNRHGVTHAEVGAHLLALWGLPHTVTEAVARHHDAQFPHLPLDSVSATRVANILIEEIEAAEHAGALPAAQFDPHYLEQPGTAEQLAQWRAVAARLFVP
jgi:putative nucleotidyltransferase with HDIG domain